jgi:hypothetical protein
VLDQEGRRRATSDWGATAGGLVPVLTPTEVLRAPVVASPRRRWPWAAGLTVLTVVLAGVGWYAYETRDSALRWQDRAKLATARGDDLQGRLDHTNDQLAMSEADVADLEGRVDELAAEKAAIADEREFVENERNIAQGERDLFIDLSLTATAAAAQMQSCVAEQDYFYGILLDTVGSYYTDWEWIGQVAADVDDVCGRAFDAADELDRAITALD